MSNSLLLFHFAKVEHVFPLPMGLVCGSMVSNLVAGSKTEDQMPVPHRGKDMLDVGDKDYYDVGQHHNKADCDAPRWFFMTMPIVIFNLM